MVTKRPSTLSAAFVRTIRQPGRYGDGRGGHGLSLLVKPMKNGRMSKTWSQRTRINGKITSLGLGSYPTVTLAQARRRALANRQVIKAGQHPRALKSPTFAEAAEKVIQHRSEQWRQGSRTPQIWASSLKKYADPLSNIPVDKITTGQVLATLAPHWHTKPATARKVRRRIASVMKWSIGAGYRMDNPADDRVTAALCTNRRTVEHLKALHHSKVAGALATIRTTSAWKGTVCCFEFLTLTATRSGEARLATWEEIDLQQEVWTIPATRTKTGRPHRVPLSAAAMNVLGNAHDLSDGTGLIFPSPRGKAMSDATMSKLCKENQIGCVPHGMRSSFRDWCGETGVDGEVAERALGHVIANKAEAAYARTDLLERRRTVMEAWGQYLYGRNAW